MDGSQSVGALPMDVKKYKIDALICAAYKWLMGPYSTALAYINEDFNEKGIDSDFQPMKEVFSAIVDDINEQQLLNLSGV